VDDVALWYAVHRDGEVSRALVEGSIGQEAKWQTWLPLYKISPDTAHDLEQTMADRDLALRFKRSQDPGSPFACLGMSLTLKCALRSSSLDA